MRPLTFTKPKFLLPVAGKPALDHVLTLLKNAGVEEIGLVVGYGKKQIIDRYGDGSEFGVKIRYLHQKELSGTANAVSLAKEFIGGERFMVMNADTLVDQESIDGLLKRYDEVHSDEDFGGVIATIEVEQPELFGIIHAEDGRVREVVEKPRRLESKLANAGIYIFDPVIFGAIGKTGKSERGEYELTTSIQILINEGKTVYTSPVNLWADIGRPWDLLLANRYFLQGQKGEIHGKIETNVHIENNVYIGEGTRVRSGSYIIGPTYIGNDCDIGPNCFIRPCTSIGDNVRIGNAVEIKNCIIMDNTNIGHLTYAGDSVIGSNCNLGAGTTIANLRLDEKPIKMEVGGQVVSSGRRKLGTIIADNVKTGINCTINVGVKIGPNSAIGPGTIVYRDVPPNTMVSLKTEIEKKEWKPE